MMESGSTVNKCKVQLINEDSTLFAQAVITEENYDPIVQRCYDSSRFFALVLISETGQKAMIGVGFPERNDSFDFIAGLDDFRKQLKIIKGTQIPVSGGVGGGSSGVKDFSLKQGEMISINIPGVTSGGPPKKAISGSSGGGLKKLAPPPGSKKLAPPSSSSH